MACRYRQHKKYRNLRPGFREQIQVAAEIFRRTSLPHPCLSLANQCDRSSASSFSDSQLLRAAIQSFPGNTGVQPVSWNGHLGLRKQQAGSLLDGAGSPQRVRAVADKMPELRDVHTTTSGKRT